MLSPGSVVEVIFGKCLLVYGRDFLARWEGLSIDEVKADWGRELGAMLRQPEAIRHGLENLPERPPNALQFRAICYGYRPPVVETLPAPVPRNPAFVRELVAKMKSNIRAARGA